MWKDTDPHPSTSPAYVQYAVCQGFDNAWQLFSTLHLCGSPRQALGLLRFMANSSATKHIRQRHGHVLARRAHLQGVTH